MADILQADDYPKLGEFIGELLTKALRQFLIIQGHQLTGKLADSIEYKVVIQADSLKVQFYMEQYGIFVNEGVSADRIPYTIGESRGKTSKYIQGLAYYAKKRFMVVSDKEALSIAFAIAHNHKKYGMPTPKSYQFSNNGYRTEFAENAVKLWEPNILEAISDFTFLFFENSFEGMQKQWRATA
jgi:hypothetical protein